MDSNIFIENYPDSINQLNDLCNEAAFQNFYTIGQVEEAIDCSIVEEKEVFIYNIKTSSSKQRKELVKQIVDMNSKICIIVPSESKKYIEGKSFLRHAPLNPSISDEFQEGVNIINIEFDKAKSIRRPSITSKSLLKQDSRRDRKKTLLTSKEAEILNHLLKGLLNKEIAMCMGISVQTVKSHLKHIYSKLEVSNRTEALLKYL